jgi:hypothetical protein
MAVGQLVAEDAALDPVKIVEGRNGAVLLKNTILKSDHFPGEL